MFLDFLNDNITIYPDFLKIAIGGLYETDY